MDLSEDMLLRDFIFKMSQRRIVKLPGRDGETCRTDCATWIVKLGS